IDVSQHVMGYERTAMIIDRLKPKVIVPHHYYIWDVVQRQSTLQTPEFWLGEQKQVEHLDGPARTYTRKELDKMTQSVISFGDHVAFDKVAWLKDGR
ncbi:MAG: MBL fold metallo-hydrolase, partial [Alphaproteobacteria bacterium]